MCHNNRNRIFYLSLLMVFLPLAALHAKRITILSKSARTADIGSIRLDVEKEETIETILQKITHLHGQALNPNESFVLFKIKANLELEPLEKTEKLPAASLCYDIGSEKELAFNLISKTSGARTRFNVITKVGEFDSVGIVKKKLDASRLFFNAEELTDDSAPFPFTRTQEADLAFMTRQQTPPTSPRVIDQVHKLQEQLDTVKKEVQNIQEKLAAIEETEAS